MATLLHYETHMSDAPSDMGLGNADARAELRRRLAELEQRARSLASPQLRHDANNAVGAARNAAELVRDARDETERARFVEIAKRNLARAEQLVGAPLADAPETDSARNERNDLRCQGESDNRDALGL